MVEHLFCIHKVTSSNLVVSKIHFKVKGLDNYVAAGKIAERLKAVDCKSTLYYSSLVRIQLFPTKAYSSMVERLAHNETAVGSIPAKLITLLRASINGKLLAFQACAVGSIPTARFMPR